jgi:hypothetical protein
MSKGHLFSQEKTHVVHCRSDWDFTALSLCIPWYCVQFIFCIQAWLVRAIQKIVIGFDHGSEIRKDHHLRLCPSLIIVPALSDALTLSWKCHVSQKVAIINLNRTIFPGRLTSTYLQFLTSFPLGPG